MKKENTEKAQELFRKREIGAKMNSELDTLIATVRVEPNISVRIRGVTISIPSQLLYDALVGMKENLAGELLGVETELDKL